MDFASNCIASEVKTKSVKAELRESERETANANVDECMVDGKG